MFFITYMLSELRRRSGRTVLTALGLGIGVGLVVTVNALSTGLDRAQAEVLEPLTGVGTDMSVSRPIDFSSSESAAQSAVSRTSPKRSANSCRRKTAVGVSAFGISVAGEKFSRDNFVSTAQLSFPATRSPRSAGSTGSAPRPGDFL